MEPTPATELSSHARALAAPRGDSRELTVYFHAAQRAHHRSVYDALRDEFATTGIAASVFLTGAEGFGRSQHVRTDRAEATWVDLPIVALAADSAAHVAAVAETVVDLLPDALITIAPTEIVFRTAEAVRRFRSEHVQLTIYCRHGRGRDDPHGVGGVLEELLRHGVAGATAFGRGNGTVGGSAYRQPMFSHDVPGPVVVVAVDVAEVLAQAVPSLLGMAQVDLMTAKPVQVCKWRGRSAEPSGTGRADAIRLTVYAGEEERSGWHPIHLALESRLRKEHAPGLTVLRGSIGCTLGDPMRPESRWFKHRGAPMATTIVDAPSRLARWLEIIDEITAGQGLITCEALTRLPPARGG